MSWPFYLALKQLFPGGRRVSFFTAMSVVGVMLGVTVLLVVTSVMGGFGQQIRRMMVETQGEVQVRARGGATIDGERALERVRGAPGVAAATPFAEGMVMIEYERRPAFPSIQGITPELVEAVAPIRKYLIAGSLDDLDDDSIILSSQLAYAIGARVGAEIEVYSPLMIERLKSDEVFLPRALRVVGLFEVGHQQLDSSVVIGTTRLVQDLYGLGGSVHGLNLRLTPGADADEVAARLNAILTGDRLQARSWREINADFLWVLQLEKNMIFFLLVFIILVASFSIASSLLTTVVRKTREIGLIAALGGRSRDVALCFCAQGLFIGLSGTGLGLLLGFGALAVRNDFVRVVSRLTGGEAAMLQAYQFTGLPAHTAAGDVIAIVGSAVVISTLAGVLPAWRAARLRPVEALRHE